MPLWPATRVTLLLRIHDPWDQEAWAEFVDLYGPLVFRFARRRLPQDDDAADITQEVLGAVLGGTYQRTSAQFQKWLVTVLLNKIRDFHTARVRRCEVSGGAAVTERLQQEPSGTEEEEWNQDRQRHLFHAAADRMRARTNPGHWQVFVRTALESQSGQDVAHALNVSLTNVYAIKSRLMKEIKDEVRQFGEDYDPGTGRRESSGEMALEMTYTAAGHGYVNAEVMKYIDEIQLKEMSDVLQNALQSDDAQAAQHVAQEMAKKCDLMGKRAEKKTMLVRQVLAELNASGHVSRKTQLALDSEAHIAEIPS